MPWSSELLQATGALTCAILARSREGLCSCTSSGRRRFTPTFLSLRTHGWERLRASPLERLISSGVEAGVLLAEGGQYSTKENCSCEQERDRCRSSRPPPMGCGSGLQVSPTCPQGAEPGAPWQGCPPKRCSPTWWQGEESPLARAGRLKLELLCMVLAPLE
jgi:hypothetical protein